ncbi:putative metal-nicotianamine transporter YSL6 [Cocos nucifera]|uniref:Putative metal-nicotianamine transporter YSL6 n=1 Tax=Cocos nucifera TaxID=13894 RepID=A0A8K0IXA7_COCNU|nr:putative metal-nicotianamine transporter YSL6 [Cocos nucifera]
MGTEVDVSEPLLQAPENGVSEQKVENIPPWRDQVTIRGLLVSALLGTLFCIITHKLNLTVGVIPSLNVAAGLLGFFFVKSWMGFLQGIGVWTKPFTRQENTVIQTCVVACYGLAFSGGFGSYMLSMDQKTYELIGADYAGNRAEDIKNPSLGWMIGFMFVVSFLGLFSLVALRKVMVIDYKLTYPSGTATALLINSIHTNTGAELARFYFDFSPIYVGCGLICPHIVSCSVLVGAIISWGFLWPFIAKHAGDWYPDNLESNDFKDNENSELLTEERLRNETFVKDSIPSWLAASGYVGLAAISTATIPIIFPQGTGLTDWSLASTYGKIGLFIFASIIGKDGGVIAGLAACGVMMSIVSTAADFKAGYLTLSSPRFMFVSQLIGTALGCIIAPLTFWLYRTACDIGSPDAACGVMMSIVSTAADFKAGYLTLSSPRFMFVSQLIGTALGCIIAPLTFWLYRTACDIGSPDGVEGLSALPKHCLEICFVFFVAALIINLLRDITPRNVSKFIPIPMAMAVPFYVGAYFAIDMFVGTIILYFWERLNQKDADDYAGAVASGLICGDGIWTVPSAILSIFRIDPPICMYFAPSVAS